MSWIIKYREEDTWFVTAASDPKEWPEGTILTIDDPLITIESLLQIWEMDLEGGNYHSMTSMPGNLVMLLRKHAVDEEIIKRVLWDIIDSGGWMS